MNYGFGPINSQSAFLTDDFFLPDDKNLIVEYINKRESLTSKTVNVREIGQYETAELITGQTWFRTDFNQKPYGRSPQVRYAYRRVFDLVALNTAPIALGSTTLRVSPLVQAIVIPTRGFGSATIAGPQYLFFPSADITFSFDNSVPDMQTVTINNSSGSVLEQCYITIEYLKQS